VTFLVIQEILSVALGKEHLHSSIKFVTPEDRHNGKDIKILANRQHVYQEAKSKNPERWS